MAALVQTQNASAGVKQIAALWPPDTAFNPRAFQPDLVALNETLRVAGAAVQALERMAAGQQPPKLGD